jgi:hypothetical protein
MWLIYYAVYEKGLVIKRGNVIFAEITNTLDVEKRAVIKSVDNHSSRQLHVVIKNMVYYASN